MKDEIGLHTAVALIFKSTFGAAICPLARLPRHARFSLSRARRCCV